MTIYYAQFDDEGLPLGFWNDDVFPSVDGNRNEAIPSDAIEISHAAWTNFIENAGQRKWNGSRAVKYEPEISEDEWFNSFTVNRANLLAETDWVVVRSLETGDSIPQEWIDYRQALRDLPENTSDYSKVKWPVRPE